MGSGGRNVYICDSFQGLPRASTKRDSHNWNYIKYMSVDLQSVKANFGEFLPIHSTVHFVKGYFRDSLPRFRTGDLQHVQLAVLRGDGDMYESYLDILFNMYDRLSVGGFFICDDCR